MKNRINLFLDSGAYSAWSKQIDIDIDEYVDFIKKHNKYIDVIANLDVIPGKWGKISSAQDVEYSARKGFDNYYYMLKKGVPKEKLIHIFHQGEDFKWLKKMMTEMEYIGISPANDKTTKQKIIWLDKVYSNYICDSNGIPKVKVHGFGVTSIPILIRYPWYSVDSTSWVLTGRFGAVYIPKKKNGKYNYHEISYKINVSDKSPKQKEAGKHFSTFTKAEQNMIQEYFEEKGYTFEELSEEYQKRDELNIIYFLDLEKNLPEWPWPFKLKTQKGFNLV